MKSDLPKPLHRIAGLSILEHVLRAVAGLEPDRVIAVVGFGHEQVRATLASFDSGSGFVVEAVHQAEQLGTGHAVQTALAVIDDPESYDVMILAGDTPLLTTEVLADLLAQHRASDSAATVLAAEVDDPTGYGRVVEPKPGPGGRRSVARIVEHADATAEQRKIKWINTSIYCFAGEMLDASLSRLQRSNVQGELYLTDVVGLLVEGGHVVGLAEAAVADDVAGVNDRVELARAARALRERINKAWMVEGATMVDPATVYLDVDVVIGRDVVLGPGVVLTGKSTVADGTVVGAGFVGHNVDLAPPGEG